MRNLKMGLALTSMAALIAGCLEPQLAPEIPKRPSTDFTLVEIQSALESPWSVAEMPANMGYLVTEKGGTLWHIKEANPKTEIRGLPDDIYVAGQGGLLDVVLAPDFLETNEIYISYSYGSRDDNGTALLRARLEGDELENVIVIFRASPPKAAASHFGGKIVFLPDETLVLSLGDGFAYREDAQKADTHLGKLVRLARDGGVPQDNPYIGKSKDGLDFKPQIYSIGHRNVQGLAYDAKSDTLWEHEHGPRGGDELNRIEAGQNYGWPLATTGLDYQGARISPYKTFEGMVDPVHDWVPSIAPSGLVIYRGDQFPEWEGDALIGGLASRDLRRVDLENGKSIGEESLLSDLNGRVRDVRLAADGGLLVLIEDSENGRLLKLLPKD